MIVVIYFLLEVRTVKYWNLENEDRIYVFLNISVSICLSKTFFKNEV